MSEHAQLCDLIADLLNEQRNTTAAVVKLTEAIAHAGTKATAAKTETTKAVEKAQAAAKYEEQKAVRAEPPAAEPAAPVAEKSVQAPTGGQPQEQQAAAAPTYDEVKDLVLKVAGNCGRQAVLDLLGKFDGATNLKQVPVEKLGEVKAAAEAALA